MNHEGTAIKTCHGCEENGRNRRVHDVAMAFGLNSRKEGVERFIRAAMSPTCRGAFTPQAIRHCVEGCLCSAEEKYWNAQRQTK